MYNYTLILHKTLKYNTLLKNHYTVTIQKLYSYTLLTIQTNKIMKLKKAIEILEIHQKWRRGAEIPMQDVKQLGIAIDLIIKTLKK